MGTTVIRALAALLVVAGPAWAAPALDYGETFVVQQAQGTPTVAVGGVVIPYREVTLAAQLPGRVNYLAGIEGNRFEEGDLLVSLDDRELLANRRALLAQMASADAQIRNASVQYSRELYSPRSRAATGGMGLPNLFDQMFTQPMEEFSGDRDRDAERSADLYASGILIQEAHNTMARLQAEMQALDSKIRDARSIAPFDGVIIKKFIEVGDTVQPGQPMLNYADLEYLQVEVDVPARLRPGLREGQMVTAELDVGVEAGRGQASRRVPARVAQIFPMADPQRHTIKVKFDLPQGVSEPGMYAKVLVPDIDAAARDTPVIPKSAVRFNGSLPGVYVVGARGEPELRLIRLGEEVAAQYVSVLSGLRPGERVLADPGPRVTAGWSRGSDSDR
ncbi:efflux RND transporter periplasmic adaptor subunit [Thiococcus pfennigii]|jgi:RND family efflux transporter MFP subunit|uniref:efflux RND transporter periplasmic adaptor subunit n=1 Tax=Thiococcus pfennigii TaxID=1057 RepID=UPI0019080E48|nr:efflux RND transporter periplasmic adaptor subunit [Thiococcus pfennigii]MBK1702575.1 efflux transporter periplasmic adaptor subunit [Thiococcus pfennigii]MBK1732465.1 efflux transporter periplasmic adaptor subunit [Thiococcus pfennigii]